MMFRAKLLKPHRWLGLGFAVLLFMQGCTGMVVAFRDELNDALHRSALTVIPMGAMRTVQSLAEMVRARHPQLDIERIEYPQHTDGALVFRMQAVGGGQLRYIAVDPYSGIVTRDKPVSGWPVEWLYRLHQQLAAGDTGHIVIGIEAVALLFFVITGPWMWWPGRRNLRRGLTVSFSHGPQRSVRELHRAGGAIAAVVLFFTSLTGIALVWPNPVRKTVGTFSSVVIKTAPAVAERAGVPFLPVDQLVARAREQFGDAHLKSVRFPGGHGRVVAAYFVGTNPRPRATDQIHMNAYTGETLAIYDATRVPAASRALDWALPIHTGEFLGFPGRIVFVLAAIALQMLTLTGVWQWWQRRQRRRAGMTAR